MIDREVIGRLRWAQWTYMVTGHIPTWVEHMTWQGVEPVIFYTICWHSILQELQVLPRPYPYLETQYLGMRLNRKKTRAWTKIERWVDIQSSCPKHLVLYHGCACVTYPINRSILLLLISCCSNTPTSPAYLASILCTPIASIVCHMYLRNYSILASLMAY